MWIQALPIVLTKLKINFYLTYPKMERAIRPSRIVTKSEVN